MKRLFSLCIPLILFLFMLRYPGTVLDGARDGLLLWFNQVFPSLFPFMVLCELLLRTNSIQFLTWILSPVLSPLFGVSRPACFAVLGGFLCGYPMGARITALLEEKGEITSEESRYLLSFVNNVSPAFVMTFVIREHLRDSRLILPGLAAVFGAPVLLSFVFRRLCGPGRERFHAAKPGGSPGEPLTMALDKSIFSALEAVARVGSYIILFSVASGLLGLVPLDGFFWNWIFLPSLEISGGIHLLCSSASLTEPVRILLVFALTSFGGLCAAFQTMYMMKGQTFSLPSYLVKKLITASVTSFLILCMLKF